MKGDAKVLDYLNQALKSELAAINQYMLHSHLLEDWGLDRLHEEVFAHAKDEMHHAQTLIRRILFLGGQPEMQEIDKLMIGKDVKSVLENDLKAEENALKLYREAAKHCESAQDYPSRDLFTGLIRDEERHYEELETQLSLIDSIGLENYQQSQIRGS